MTDGKYENAKESPIICCIYIIFGNFDWIYCRLDKFISFFCKIKEISVSLIAFIKANIYESIVVLLFMIIVMLISFIARHRIKKKTEIDNFHTHADMGIGPPVIAVNMSLIDAVQKFISELTNNEDYKLK